MKGIVGLALCHWML